MGLPPHPRSLRPAHRRLLLVLATPVLATVALAWLLRPHLGTANTVVGVLSDGALPPFADLVVGACAGVVALCWTWLVAGSALVAWQTLRPGSPLARLRLRWVPRFLRAVVPALVVPLVALAPASADVGGLPLPDRPTTPEPALPQVAAAPPAAPVASPESGSTATTVVVRPGDSLWSIAASRLPERASLAAVDRAWRRIARTNAARVPDPHLIAPGLRLRLPHLADPKDIS